ncbi:MAG: type II toxin-antitoxin system VapC family toxin [Phycisphaerae bacterium]|nr:type II toxin-antitoxin system VapC family toxin [Phycisphaerae bacterium]
MAEWLLLDTDVLVDYLRGQTQAIALVQANHGRIVISSMTVAELYAGVREGAERAALEEIESLFPVLPVTAEAARSGGLLRRDFGKSHGISIADAIVAATALAEDAELATLNVRHYPMIKGLRPAYLKK